MSVDGLAHIEHGLVLCALATSVEVVFAADLCVAEIADLEQLLQPLM